MKKIFTFIISVMLLVSCFAFSSSAQSKVTFSDDFKILYYNSNSYRRIDDTFVEVEEYSEKEFSAEFSQQQRQEVKGADISMNTAENLAEVCLYYKDGSELSVSFLIEKQYDNFCSAVQSNSEEYQIDFEWPDKNQVIAKKEALFGEKTTLPAYNLNRDQSFTVNVSLGEDLGVRKGLLVVISNEYYYVDFSEAGIDRVFYEESEMVGMPCRKITDEKLNLSIKEAMNKYYDDGLGFFWDDDFSKAVSNIFIIVLFVVIPLAILIVFLVMAIRSKTYYRKFFVTICVLVGLELITFAITAFIFTLCK